MDMTAFTLCNENKLPIMVFNMNTPEICNVVNGKDVGTLVNFKEKISKMNEELQFVLIVQKKI